MLTLKSCNFVLKQTIGRFEKSHFPSSSCILNRLSSTLNESNSTVKSVSASTTDQKKLREASEKINSKQNNSKRVVSNEKIKKKLGKYVEGDKINYKEVHKVVFSFNNYFNIYLYFKCIMYSIKINLLYLIYYSKRK